MNIHQISLAYQLDQDRILVQISTHNGEALRLWLTRRLMASLLPHLIRVATEVEVANARFTARDEMGKKVLMDFKKQESIAQADFKTPFKPDAAIFPVGVDPLLVTTVNLTATARGELIIGFEEKFAETVVPRSFDLTMAPSLLHSFMHLLESAVKVSGWGLLPHALPDATADEAGDKPGPYDGNRYLN